MRILAALMLALLLVTPVNAGNPNLPLVFTGIWYGQQNTVVEQQSDQHWPPDPYRYNPDWLHYVVNPFTDCKWNGDDNADLIQTGRILKAGQTASGDYCKVADSNSNYVCINNDCEWWSFSKHESIGFIAYSKNPDLVVKLTYQPQGKVFTLSPTYDTANKLYRWGICVGIFYNKQDPAMSFIPGSNGSNDPNSIEGVGVKTTITPSITNPTGRDIREISYVLTVLGASQPTDNGCKYGSAEYQTTQTKFKEYPFTWYYE